MIIRRETEMSIALCIDSSRVYAPPDPPGYFDGHVWPMYLKNRQEMENMVSGIGECLWSHKAKMSFVPLSVEETTMTTMLSF